MKGRCVCIASSVRLQIKTRSLLSKYHYNTWRKLPSQNLKDKIFHFYLTLHIALKQGQNVLQLQKIDFTTYI